jgi:hypothetical protein
MDRKQQGFIVACWLVGLTLMGSIGVLTAAAPAARASEGVLYERLQQWPTWNLPAPLARPGRADLLYPEWCAGHWQVRSSDGSSYEVRFPSTPAGVVGDRAFNAAAVGRAVLGKGLLGVANDPANPNRQIARLRNADGQELELESTVVGRRSERPEPTVLLVDELALQVLHCGGAPLVSRVETLSRFERLSPDRIQVEQWQATYASPALGLAAPARRNDRFELSLSRSGQGADRAS